MAGRPPYEPPIQSVLGQIVDAVLMLVLVFITLYLPLLFKLAGGGTSTTELPNPTWDSLGQNATMAGQWEKLGFTPEKAAGIIGTRFDYSFNWGLVALTAAIIVGYFIVMFRYSDRQYREVIAEHFDGSSKG
ncbi:hypothetical protein [Methylorubrum thiocyanatum]|uniref:Uncharacterized protein n=1 Tax=Methylorubrum thiocyanatum TaxID=47958 RepID=A0AA40S0K2_9HYPH|nr:hypothetical protein [Methylorubrum thiocyanatum]MBA8912371.1 hypothetical protein [Methylorubrum thiocyanatum]GJE81164.1 hypothetical protein CJNNKLLH_2510 [Methylorubrum thiocyanatum]